MPTYENLTDKMILVACTMLYAVVNVMYVDMLLDSGLYIIAIDAALGLFLLYQIAVMIYAIMQARRNNAETYLGAGEWIGLNEAGHGLFLADDYRETFINEN